MGAYARTNADGLPIGIEITPGQAHDVTTYPALTDDIDCDPDIRLPRQRGGCGAGASAGTLMDGGVDMPLRQKGGARKDGVV